MGGDHLFWYQHDRLQHVVMDRSNGFREELIELVPPNTRCWNLDLKRNKWYGLESSQGYLETVHYTAVPKEIHVLCTLLNLDWRR